MLLTSLGSMPKSCLSCVAKLRESEEVNQRVSNQKRRYVTNSDEASVIAAAPLILACKGLGVTTIAMPRRGLGGHRYR
jgi:hypothetical protein